MCFPALYQNCSFPLLELEVQGSPIRRFVFALYT
jgi:hypothetical protein